MKNPGFPTCQQVLLPYVIYLEVTADALTERFSIENSYIQELTNAPTCDWT